MPDNEAIRYVHSGPSSRFVIERNCHVLVEAVAYSARIHLSVSCAHLTAALNMLQIAGLLPSHQTLSTRDKGKEEQVDHLFLGWERGQGEP